MQFCLIMLVLFVTVAVGAIWSPLYMPIPLMCWLVIQILLYHAGRNDS